MRLRTYRLTSQVVFAIISIGGIFGLMITGLIYPYFFCYGCPFAVGACPIGLLEHSFVDLHNGLLSGLALLVYLFGFLSLVGILSGRAFCGWGCPIGLLQDATNKTGISNHACSKLAPKGVNPRLKLIKYVILALIPLPSYIFLKLMYTNLCPVGGVTGTLPTLLFFGGDWQPSSFFGIKILSVVLFTLLVLLVGRGWCKYLCPVGAFLAPWNKVSGIRLTRDEKKCTECGLCDRSCPMDMKDVGRRADMECILCGRCVEACKNDALKIHTRFSKEGVRASATWLVTVALIVALLSVGIWGGGYERSEEINSIPCLGCLALNPTASMDFEFLTDVAQSVFVSTTLNSRPVFLHYRTDACSACDDMEPVVERLEETYDDDVVFIHINLDHSTNAEKASYDLYDVKGTPQRRGGVPMFTVITLNRERNETLPYYATSYGIQEESALAGSIGTALELYELWGGGSTSVEEGIGLRVEDPHGSVLPNGTASFTVTVQNFHDESLQLSASTTFQTGWSAEISSPSITVQALNTKMLWVNITGSDRQIGQTAEFELVVHSVPDTSISTSATLYVEVKSDVVPPTMSDMEHMPERPEQGQILTVSVNASDETGLANISISYSWCTDELCGLPIEEEMVQVGDSFVAEITPPSTVHTELHYSVTATDTSGNANTSELVVVQLDTSETSPIWPYVALALFLMMIIMLIIESRKGKT